MVSVSSGAQSEVRLNSFAAPVLTGDDGPDQNQVVGFFSSSTGLIDDNTFAGCAFYDCVRVGDGTVVTVSNNDFTHVSGQM